MKNMIKVGIILAYILTLVLIVLINGYLMKGASEMNENGSDIFGIYIATMSGKNMTLIISDSWREMTHARVSPDKEWITFTRYNKRGEGGLAMEKDGYDYTEIMLIRTDGTGLRNLIPPKEGIASCNSYWTPDGRGLLYVSTDNSGRKPEIRRIDLDEKMEILNITTLPVPENLLPVDPHQVGDSIVFPAFDTRNGVRGIWIMNADGGNLRQLTMPKDPETNQSIAVYEDMYNGDNDPKLSPDGSKVAFMRHVKDRYLWHILIVDVRTGEEKDLSAAYIPPGYNAADGMPEWSSDGELLIFWHPDAKTGRVDLCTMKPDGSERKKIPLPEGCFYKMASFFPEEGSGENAQIVFSRSTVV